MSKPLILVTGATGNTGAPVVEQLLEKGYPVRAFVHRLDERSKLLSELGAEVVEGDFLDISSLEAAMKGVKRVYFVYPPADKLLEATMNVAIAAKREGIYGLVNMPQLPSREAAPSSLTYSHWQSEQILDWADIGASHINPTFFAEDLYLFTGRSIASEGKMYLPFGEGKHAPVAASDIARVVVATLIDPQPHVGQRYAITGSKNMNMLEVAQVLSNELGKKVEYVDLPLDYWREALTQQPEFSEYLADHLAHVAQDHQDGVFSVQNDLVEQIGGLPPQSVEDFVRTHIDNFTA
ncbi:MAG: NAD-dependent epimerase/dehydratase family protein [Thermodesulfobacteriales bacterium]|nr:MAG: NAD-dependent epimerase/dehydratase family protein [Thermodesulfobacteriales bacterium]